MSTRIYRNQAKLLIEKNSNSESIKKSLLSVSRRSFVIGLTSSFAFFSACSRVLTQQNHYDKLNLNTEPWGTLDAIYLHLLPVDGNGPSAKEANATDYLFKVYTSSRTTKYNKKTIINGENLVNNESIKLYSKKFIFLADNQKEKVLRNIEKTDEGKDFLSLMLDYLFEALLGDPVYGGQQKYAGWQWLEHIPGFPRPQKPNPKVI